jgi:putative FmdB family regulatory protein
MPVNEYQCEQCGKRLDWVRRWGTPHLDKCPDCAGPLRQVYHSFVFRFRRRNWRPYTVESSERAERHMEARIGEDELVK